MPEASHVRSPGAAKHGNTAGGARRQAREAALQILYLSDLSKTLLSDLPVKAWSDEPLSSKTRDFAQHLAAGVLETLGTIDTLLKKYAENWELSRMAAVDRCILRLATFELIKDVGTPENVIINEAVEIAKKYSTAESSKFVNGILDKLKKERL